MPSPEFLDCEVTLTDFDRATLRVTDPEEPGRRRDYSGKPRLRQGFETQLPAPETDLKEYGIRLFQALFPPDDDLSKGYLRCRAGNRSLRFRLHVDTHAPPELHDLCWELLFDPQEGGLALARARGTVFSRYLSVERPVPGAVLGKLRVLTAVSRPVNLAEYDLPPFDREEVCGSVRQALGPLGEDWVEHEVLDGPVTARRIHERLAAGAFHVLNLFAHGHVRDQRQQASLALESEDRKVRWVHEEEFAEIFEGGNDLRFLCLVACHGGRKSGDDPFSGLGPRLVRHVPAVVAMRREVSIDAAERFTRYFYRGLAQSGQLDVAANYARGQMYHDDPERGDWWIPALFLRLADGVLWEPPLPCPYLGLESFEEKDSVHFFGRDGEVRRLSAMLAGGSVAVLGPSGSGKSSVVKAGLVPRLRNQGPPETTWEVVLFTPGNEPLARLTAALRDRFAELGTDPAETETVSLAQQILDSGRRDRLLVVADQFEEVVTQTPEEERRSFARALIRMGEELPKATLLLTLRADFYSEVMSLDPGLSHLLEQRTFHLHPMERAEREQSITGPAEKVGLAVASGLVNRMLDDLGEEPGNLPLLEFALTELWRRDPGRRRLTHESYEAMGTVRQAIAQRADEIYDSFSRDKQEAVRHALTTRLVSVAERAEDRDTRRRARLSKLDADLLEELVQERLLVTRRDPRTREETVELAHDALLLHWEALRRWVEEDRDFLRWLRRLRRAMDEGRFYRGHELKQAQHWVREYRERLDHPERRFVERAVRKSRNRLSLFTLAAVVLLVAMAFSLFQSLDARKRKRIEEARELAQRSAETGSRFPQRSLLLAVEAAKRTPRADERPVEVEEALRQALSSVGGRPLCPREPVRGATLGIGKRWLVTQPEDGQLRLWPLTETAEVSGPFVNVPDVGERTAVELSPDGGWMAVTGGKLPAQLWRLSSTQLLKPAFETRAWEHNLRFSPDGDGVAIALQASEGEEIWELQWWRWDELRRPTRVFPLDKPGCESMIHTLEVSSGSRWLVTVHSDDRARLWDLQDETPSCPTLPIAAIHDAAFHPGGPWLLLASDEGLILTRPGSLEVVERFDAAGPVCRVAFGPEGRSLVVETCEKQSSLWGFDQGRLTLLQSGLPGGVKPGGGWFFAAQENRLLAWRGDGASSEPLELRGHDEDGPRFAAGPRWLVTWTREERARRWDLGAAGPAAGLEPRILWAGEATEVSFLAGEDSPQLVAVSREEGLLRLGEEGASRLECPGQDSPWKDFALSRDRGWLVSLDVRGTACLWQLVAPRPILASSFPLAGDLLAVADDGAWVAWTSGRLAYLAKLGGGYRPGEPVVLEGSQEVIQGIGFAPANHWLATAGSGEPTRLWELTAGGMPGDPRELSPRTRGSLHVLLFDTSGGFLFAGGAEDQGRLWPTEGQAPPRIGPVTGVRAAGFGLSGPDSERPRWLAVGDLRGWVHLWDLEREATTARPLRVGEGPVTAIAFSPDGGWLAAATERGARRLWSLTREPGLSEPLTLPPADGEVRDLTFSPDDLYLVTAGHEGVLLWRLSASLDDHLVDLACESAGRDLSPDEWRDILGKSRSFEVVCPDKPHCPDRPQ